MNAVRAIQHCLNGLGRAFVPAVIRAMVDLPGFFLHTEETARADLLMLSRRLADLVEVLPADGMLSDADRALCLPSDDGRGVLAWVRFRQGAL